MEIIRGAISLSSPGDLQIPLRVDRLTLAKRRWRGVAENGREFGFDLDHALRDGDVFYQDAGAAYLLAQLPEPVLEIALASPAESARAGWTIGNLHFPMQIDGDSIRVADDPAIRQMFAREGLAFVEAVRVFHPLHAVHAHSH